MKTYNSLKQTGFPALFKIILIFTAILFIQKYGLAQETKQLIEYKGRIIDQNTKDPLPFVNLEIAGTNIATVTNSEGDFSLKINEAMPQAKVSVTYPGYKKLLIILADFTNIKNTIELEPQALELDEINITRPKDAKSLISKVFANRKDNYLEEQTYMTAFYREAINKRNRSASLAEAVVAIKKQPYINAGNDLVAIYKARKSTNYNRLDTLAIKLQGGPLNALYADLVKYPEYFMTLESLSNYEFNFGESLMNDGKMIYVVNFKQKETIIDPLYYGKLYIEAKTYALTNAIYNINVENRELASALFVKKKPNRVKVYPTEISYRVDYRNTDGKWYYGYSNVNLEFVVNWKRKLFNNKYRITSEMLITDWELQINAESISNRTKFKASTILADEASGFADPDFWGTYNVIEPEKSIQQAIEKIQRQIKMVKS
ncbi:carboxypeptidase-like regulatory domain-containing protein [Leeuwenhoekiella marinoflava]|uniref:Carboxypeptidase-like protein n=2 Tax=Leeuwenhoekiella marinoflava TaxID=988 RepID=A0A4Q0PPX4_9FLAO|nr:carboxypeptidase-like regulatory domain-containing protein [Leeuwenhoekiella marinoflava]RXG32524.1 carboxypeptidase-like protein [Leeuwenhoekiella marinoflava]SHE68551.1 CarboxypepD_reg-like domain-containing protein [Leeuwenhoekiella marinoflava DSM 3653]